MPLIYQTKYINLFTTHPTCPPSLWAKEDSHKHESSLQNKSDPIYITFQEVKERQVVLLKGQNKLQRPDRVLSMCLWMTSETDKSMGLGIIFEICWACVDVKTNLGTRSWGCQVSKSHCNPLTPGSWASVTTALIYPVGGTHEVVTIYTTHYSEFSCTLKNFNRR